MKVSYVLIIYGRYNYFFVLNFFKRNGKFIEWRHVRNLYEKLTMLCVQSRGLSLVSKLTSEHINLNSYSRMRVDLAAQVSY